MGRECDRIVQPSPFLLFNLLAVAAALLRCCFVCLFSVVLVFLVFFFVPHARAEVLFCVLCSVHANKIALNLVMVNGYGAKEIQSEVLLVLEPKRKNTAVSLCVVSCVGWLCVHLHLYVHRPSPSPPSDKYCCPVLCHGSKKSN